MPDARKKHETLQDFISDRSGAGLDELLGNYPKFAVSYFKAQFGDAATKDNNYGYDFPPQDHP